MNPNIPVYKLTINEDDGETGVLAVALVDDPAIQRNWQAFADQSNPYKFTQTDAERRIISGPLMIANLPIYRVDEQLGEYYAVFTKKDIEKIVLKFHRNSLNKSTNMMHDPMRPAERVYMFENYIIDRGRGQYPPEAYKSLPDGSWFGSYKVDNDAVWNDFIKTGEFKGFSVEGNFEMSLYREAPADKVGNWINAVQGLFTKLPDLFGRNTSLKNDAMSPLQRLKEFFTAAADDIKKLSEEAPPAAFTEALLADGTAIQIDGELAEGSKVFTVDAEGNQTPAPDGELTLQDGTVITVQGGTITAVAPPEAPSEEMAADAKTIDELKSALADLVSQFNSYKTAQEKEQAFLRQKVQDLTKAQKSTFAVVQAIAEEPAAEPVHKPAGFSTADKADKAAAGLAAAIKAKISATKN